MTVYILGVATLILLALILWRGSSAEVRRRSELPKFKILENLESDSSGIHEEKDTQDQPPTPKGNHE